MQVWQIEKHNTSTHAGLSGKITAGMLNEWQWFTKHPSCNNNQPIVMLERSGVCRSYTSTAGIFVAAAELGQHAPVCCIDKEATVLSAKASQCKLACLMERHRSSSFSF